MPIAKPDFEQLLNELGSERFHALRPGQRMVLEDYASEHLETADLAIELPTGAGKSLIALLIGEAWRREDRTVGVLTGNKALAVQMEEEGKDLGVEVNRMEGRGEDIPLSMRRAYRRGKAIGIMNYWVMFNSNPVVDPADLLIVDDVHLAEGALESDFTLEIDRYRHPTAFGRLAEELVARLPDYHSLEDAASDGAFPRSGVELMSFLDQTLVEGRMREIIDNATELDTDADLRFSWRWVRERLASCNVYLSSRSFTIRPYCLPTQTISRWRDPEQRIYLSATVGDPADLQRRLGSGTIVKIGGSDDAPTLGRRLIILNNDVDQADDVLFPARISRAILASLNKQPKAVWMCASHSQADLWEQSVLPWLKDNGIPDAPAWRIGRHGQELEAFKSAKSGHLFTAGRYDGMDFAGEDCRLVVLGTIPRAVNDQEQFFSDYLRDASFLIDRTNQRIVQALGRCNRVDDDYAIYVLADRRLSAHLSQERNRRGFPAPMQAELDLAEELDDLSNDELGGRVKSFLDQDFQGYDDELGQLLEEVPEPITADGDEAGEEVEGWLALAGHQDYLRAEERLEERRRKLEELGLMEISAFTKYTAAKAAHLEGRRGDGAARARAIESINSAIELGGGSSSWFNRLRGSVRRGEEKVVDVAVSKDDFRAAMARAFDEQLEVTPPGPKLDRWRRRLADKINSENHDTFLKGLGQLGELLGYSTVFPKYGAATDCRWHGVFGNRREAFTFEAKIEHRDDKAITAKGVGQAHGQKARAVSELEPRGFSVRGLIVTHLVRLAADAAPGLGDLVVIRREAIEALHGRVDGLLVQFAANWSLDEPIQRVTAINSLAQDLPDTGWLLTAVDSTEDFLGGEQLLAAWP